LRNAPAIGNAAFERTPLFHLSIPVLTAISVVKLH
jgi:hypothetical protein